MWATTLWNESLPSLQWGTMIGLSLIAAVCDLRCRRIPNAMTVPMWLAGLGLAFGRGGWPGVADALAAGLLLALPYVALFIFCGGGAGDAKLMAVLGAWLGLVNGLIALAAVCLAGVAWGLLFAAAKRRLRDTLARVAVTGMELMWRVVASGGKGLTAVSEPVPSAQTLPYGLAIFTGVCISAGGVFLWRS